MSGHHKRRNDLAEKVIAKYAREHAAVDTGSGLLLGLLPFGNWVAVGGQLVYSGVRVYPAMVESLAAVYEVDLGKDVRRGLPLPTQLRELVERGAETAAVHLIAAKHTAILQEIARELAAQHAAHVAAGISNDFGTEFLQEIVGELLGENVPAALASAVPILGAVVGAGADAVLGATMTWRVGATASVYYQNGGYIGSRKRTYELVKPLVKKSARWERPGTLAKVRELVKSR